MTTQRCASRDAQLTGPERSEVPAFPVNAHEARVPAPLLVHSLFASLQLPQPGASSVSMLNSCMSLLANGQQPLWPSLTSMLKLKLGNVADRVSEISLCDRATLKESCHQRASAASAFVHPE